MLGVFTYYALRCLLILSLTLEAGARAVEWYHVFRHSDLNTPSNNFLPKPTQHSKTTEVAHAAVVTSPPEVPQGELMVKRQQENQTCGYYGGISSTSK